MNKLVKDSDNALNICSFGALFSLWHLSMSPAFYIMEEMKKYSSLNAFLAECADSDIDEFLPEISLNKLNKEDNGTK